MKLLDKKVSSRFLYQRPDYMAERVGWPLRGAEGGCAAARLEQGPKAHTALGRKTKWAPQGGPFLFSGGEGGIRTHGTGKPYT